MSIRSRKIAAALAITLGLALSLPEASYLALIHQSYVTGINPPLGPFRHGGNGTLGIALMVVGIRAITRAGRADT